MNHQISKLVLCYFLLLLGACASDGPYEIDLMPTPDVYDEKQLTPFTDADPLADHPFRGVLYATDRAAVSADDEKEDKDSHYLNERGHVVRLGAAYTELGDETITWEEARRISLLKNRTDKYPLKVTGVDEFGLLDSSIHEFTPADMIPEDRHEAARYYAEIINAKLARSSKKDIYVYLHGYKVVFDNPILVTAELWHFLGYEGVFIAYAWPSTPKLTAYFGDAETTISSSLHFRQFLEYLAAETDAERIHVIAYSQGTRIAVESIYNLALLYNNATLSEIRNRVKIGSVLLLGSDVDAQIFGMFLTDGLLRIPERLSIYMSSEDEALEFSNWLLDKTRLGEAWATDQISDKAKEYLKTVDNLDLINVSNTEGADTGNGHGYFRSSPWASSDVLMTLLHNLSPAQRGLVRAKNNLHWVFPDDYIERLRHFLLE